MTVAALFIRDLSAFPVAWVSGERSELVKEKAVDFLRSVMRIAFAGGVIFTLYKGHYFYANQRKFEISITRLTMTFARIPLTIEPIAMTINICLLLTSESILRKGVYSLWFVAQLFNPLSIPPPRKLFSATIQKNTLRIDLYSILANLTLNKVKEAQLGMGLYITSFGISQLAAFTMARSNFQESRTELALKGILHLMIGLDCLGMYERYSQSLEKGDAKKQSYIYKAAAKLAPGLAWLAGRS